MKRSLILVLCLLLAGSMLAGCRKNVGGETSAPSTSQATQNTESTQPSTQQTAPSTEQTDPSTEDSGTLDDDMTGASGDTGGISGASARAKRARHMPAILP